MVYGVIATGQREREPMLNTYIIVTAGHTVDLVVDGTPLEQPVVHLHKLGIIDFSVFGHLCDDPTVWILLVEAENAGALRNTQGGTKMKQKPKPAGWLSKLRLKRPLKTGDISFVCRCPCQ